MKILLIYPEFANTFWAMRETLKVLGKRAWFPPLGLLTVASLLPEEWELKLIDLSVKKITDEELKWADYVFISAMNVQEESARRVIDKCKALNVKTVAGGPLFTHEYEKFADVDHLVLNEAEITLIEFLSDLKTGNQKPIYRTEEFTDVTETPTPKWELIDLNDYQHGILQYSRGCPYNCEFCDVTALLGHKQRTRTTQQIIEDLEIFHRHDKFFQIFFADDNLIGNKKKLKEDLLPAIIEWRKKKQPTFWFVTQVSINIVDDRELMELLLEAGFRYLFIGIESPSEENLEECNKRHNKNRDLLANVKTLHGLGFTVLGGFIIGFDSDTPQTHKELSDFIQASGIVHSTVNVLKAPPGTDLFKRLKDEGRLVENFSFHEMETNIKDKINNDIHLAGIKSVTKYAYSPEHVYERVKLFLTDFSMPNLKNKDPDATLKFVKYLPRIIFYVGIIDKSRWLFWKILFWTLFNKRELLGVAFFNAITVFQLGKLYESYAISERFR
jgi:radical SAM superfamily enzyme YgiQ (UPF0313 family)